ncbi:succinate dehydrogenase assembly factor 2 [Celeribacter sp.]|uniref:succinate dehydrogenase assembly factor 2 n=1 Tax=Celeribacter sp. TaxID=1890673 RepID=UPI003A8E4071
MSETHEHRLKRINIRAWRRGIKEMDLLIGGYADANLASMSEAELDAFEALMDENDQDLLAWATGQQDAPADLKPTLDKVVAFADPELWLKK